MEGNERIESMENGKREEYYSSSFRSRQRTYYFDVRPLKQNNAFYLTITESKKRFAKDGKYYYEKHKIFLFKEDFENFLNSLNETMNYIKDNSSNDVNQSQEELITEDYSIKDIDDIKE
jgi:hypothetical protein